MSFRFLGVLAMLGALPLAVSGCGGTCSNYCETYVACLDEDLPSGCGFDDSDEDVIADCENECVEAFDKLTGDEADEADACITCIFDEIGGADECNDGDFVDAVSDCDDECEEDGADEFAEEFLADFNPDIDCSNGIDDGPGPPSGGQ